MLRKKADLALFQQNFQILFLSLSDFPEQVLRPNSLNRGYDRTAQSSSKRQIPATPTRFQSPNLVFSSPFVNGKWVKSFRIQAASSIIRLIFQLRSWESRWVRTRRMMQGGEIGDVFPKCGIARRETYFGATWSWQRPSFGYLASLWHQIHISGNLWKKVAPISFKFSNCEKVSSGDKWSQHLKPPYDGHFYPMRQR